MPSPGLAWRRMLAGVFFAVLAACASLARASTVDAAEFTSNTLGRTWAYNIYLPTGYDPASDVRYPVLYLLHGNGADRNEWTVRGHIQKTVDALIAAGEMPPAIIVMPDAGTTWYVDLKAKMETAFFDDLMPMVEKRYKALPTRDGRVIAGVSMGGYGALRYALKYPQLFQAAALLSPAVYNPEPPLESSARAAKVFALPGTDGVFNVEVWKANNYPALWDGFLKKGIRVPMYIVAGDDDDYYIEGESAQLYSLLRRHKQPSELRIVNGRHDWAVWEPAIGDALKYIFLTVRRPQAL